VSIDFFTVPTIRFQVLYVFLVLAHDRRQVEALQHWVSLRQRQCKWPVIQESERVKRKDLLSGLSTLSLANLTDDYVANPATPRHVYTCWGTSGLCASGASLSTTPFATTNAALTPAAL